MNRIVLTLAGLLTAGVLSAQEPKGPGTPLALLAHEKVRKELKLSGEQADQLKTLKADSGDVREKLGKILEPGQLKRLGQISLQVRGGEALTDRAVANELKLTKKQRADIAEAKSDADRTLPMFLQVARFRNAEARRKYIRNHYKQAGDKMLAVLTSEQKKQFTKMQGKAFDTAGLDR
jgi:hypothetical protein